MAGTRRSIIAIIARERGLTVDEYEAKRAAGLKWCTACGDWQPVSAFGSDKSRGDGYAASCRAGRSIVERVGRRVSPS